MEMILVCAQLQSLSGRDVVIDAVLGGHRDLDSRDIDRTTLSTYTCWEPEKRRNETSK